jgi:hypothetical protein
MRAEEHAMTPVHPSPNRSRERVRGLFVAVLLGVMIIAVLSLVVGLWTALTL